MSQNKRHSPGPVDIIAVLEQQDGNMIGDFSRPHTLPTIPGKHSDLQSITPTTLALLLDGQFSSAIEDFTIVDCRYPYEYDAGHIHGALNIWNQDQLREYYQAQSSSSVLVFHCEFSSERGPMMSRFLRELDRASNRDSYPCLNFPEVYLLDSGYKSFYEECVLLCEPPRYVPMLHQDYSTQLKSYRKETKAARRTKSRRGRRQLML